MKVLITIDGSDRALRAIDAVAGLSQNLADTEVILLNVRERAHHYGDFPPFDAESVEARQQAAQDDMLQAAARHAATCGLTRVSHAAAHGVPASEIVRVARERAVDQIAMGTHGRTALGGLFLGSVAQRVLHLSETPLLLVK
ncbi:universal stress protein [Piscinibacter gummiphilus]|uniref:Uncharacterized protein n=1 Tax=Piscinibacter gummiphilus TaxID=946333 RepID=A0A1W6L5M0_9BURK|nr:universal stress protein [Piscinibacter gummiphilus]ARN19477.1 hypothetical protein A4W93_05870 [Piscinibacter gummiphilus]GLS92882.1 universal stress protein [Piscinibacter gummiphilus]